MGTDPYILPLLEKNAALSIAYADSLDRALCCIE